MHVAVERIGVCRISKDHSMQHAWMSSAIVLFCKSLCKEDLPNIKTLFVLKNGILNSTYLGWYGNNSGHAFFFLHLKFTGGPFAELEWNLLRRNRCWELIRVTRYHPRSFFQYGFCVSWSWYSTFLHVLPFDSNVLSFSLGSIHMAFLVPFAAFYVFCVNYRCFFPSYFIYIKKIQDQNHSNERAIKKIKF
jgi:hypothetical protein